MNLTIKLLAREPFSINVERTSLVRTVKEMMYDYLRIPIEEQRLIFQGVILHDDQPLSDYVGLKNGSKVHLVMVTKKKHPLYEKLYHIVRPHHSEKETQKILSIFMRKIYDSFKLLSLDDLERIAHQELTERSVPAAEKMIVD